MATEVGGDSAAELLFTLAIDLDIGGIFLRQIAGSDPCSLHVSIQDRAGTHLPINDPRLPANLRLLPLPPYRPELDPVERLGGLIKARVCNRLHPSLARLGRHIEAVVRGWLRPG